MTRAIRWGLIGLGLAAATACLSSRGVPTETAGGECVVPLSANVPGSTLVVIRNFTFEPAEVRIKPGASITWVNCDAAGQPAHTSTADQSQWDSGSLAAGQAFNHPFSTAGRFPYHCEPHPFMKGTIVVE
jgi:plastocyanin